MNVGALGHFKFSIRDCRFGIEKASQSGERLNTEAVKIESQNPNRCLRAFPVNKLSARQSLREMFMIRTN
jgi:hypothetical protein